MGASRFNELQRGLSLISPTLLTKRLNELAAAGVILKIVVHQALIRDVETFEAQIFLIDRSPGFIQLSTEGVPPLLE